jgi:hypothetical protein
MRKVIFRNGDKVIELDISDEAFVSSHQIKTMPATEQILKTGAKKEASDDNNLISKDESKTEKQNEWEIILDTTAEIRGRKEQSLYIFHLS